MFEQMTVEECIALVETRSHCIDCGAEVSAGAHKRTGQDIRRDFLPNAIRVRGLVCDDCL